MTATIALTTPDRAPEHGPNCAAWCDNNRFCTGADCTESSLYVPTETGGLLGVGRQRDDGQPVLRIDIDQADEVWIDGELSTGRRVVVEATLTPEQAQAFFGGALVRLSEIGAAK